jgi:hypothetical protein
MNRTTAIILLVIIVALGGLVVYLNANPELTAEPTATPSSVSEPLWEVDPGQVAVIEVTDNENQATFSAARDAAGQWKVTQPEAGDADPLQMSTLTGTVSALFVSQRITEPVDLADFGLAEPKFTIAISLTDGTSHRVAVGNQAVGGFSYYVLPQGETQPALVGSASLDSLLLLPSQPPLVTPTPGVTPETPAPLSTLPLSGTPP